MKQLKYLCSPCQSQCCQTGAGIRHSCHTKLKPMVNTQPSLPHRHLGQQCRNPPLPNQGYSPCSSPSLQLLTQ